MAAAPSVIWDELPAVVEPFLSKAGLSLPSPATVVSGLTPQSLSTTTSTVSPFSFLTVVL
jgi:hypothetical protein